MLYKELVQLTLERNEGEIEVAQVSFSDMPGHYGVFFTSASGIQIEAEFQIERVWRNTRPRFEVTVDPPTESTAIRDILTKFAEPFNMRLHAVDLSVTREQGLCWKRR